MAKNVVIVESPAKVKTIKKFLGSNYEVCASQGHVRDLPKSQLGIDVEHDYEPKYITIRGKGDVLAKLRKETKKAEHVYLATDPDREGEAISWHLYEALKLADKDTHRITFNEITKNAVKESLKSPREIDMDLVDAQQARRILDRIVGYKISPLLWTKIKRGLSAGRVQSVALRIICDREEQIAAFIPQEYWTLDATLHIGKVGKAKKGFTASFYSDENGRREIRSKADADRIEAIVSKAAFVVREVKRGERGRKNPLPFTTSTMQQEASKALNFSTQKTMRVAQSLYEDGYISYLRTDSTRVSAEAAAAAVAHIESHYGKDYLGSRAGKKDEGKKIQDAHEAIRPTDLSKAPEDLKAKLGRDELRLYQLIYRRFLASQMAPAVYDTLSMKLDAGGVTFSASAQTVKFDGFMRVYTDDESEKAKDGFLLSDIDEKTQLNCSGLEKKQHFTQPPAHYTEASLVRALEELGIGRPSTYAPTITTIIARRYIIKESKNLYVSELGEIVNKVMKEEFPAIVDVNFTATMEGLLDNIGEGKTNWRTVIANFYPDLDAAVKRAEAEMAKIEIKDEESGEICENCGRPMVIKYGPHGRFQACPGFPECRNTKPYYERIGVPCPRCGKDMVVRMTKKGRRYYGCEGYPECDFMVWNRPVKTACPKCGGLMVKKGSKLVCNDAECGHVQADEGE